MLIFVCHSKWRSTCNIYHFTLTCMLSIPVDASVKDFVIISKKMIYSTADLRRSARSATDFNEAWNHVNINDAAIKLLIIFFFSIKIQTINSSVYIFSRISFARLTVIQLFSYSVFQILYLSAHAQKTEKRFNPLSSLHSPPHCCDCTSGFRNVSIRQGTTNKIHIVNIAIIAKSVTQYVSHHVPYAKIRLKMKWLKCERL